MSNPLTFYSFKELAWIIHEPRLMQMRGVTHAAVVVHRKWVTTKQMRQNRLARRVKNADEYKKNSS